MLWVSRQRELTFQPTKYFPEEDIGVEMGNLKTEGDEKYVFSTIQTLHRRLDKFKPDEFDLLVADECFTGDVEILTNEGFVRFDQLGDQKVAQLHDDFRLDYIQPTRKIQYHYEGDMIGSRLDASSRTGGEWIYMTPNHNQVYFDERTQTLESAPIQYFKDTWDNRLRIVDRLTKGNDNERRLTDMERIYIMVQADGSLIYEKDNHYRFRLTFSKQRKIDRLLELCENAGIEVTIGAEREFDNPNWKSSRNHYITLGTNPKLLTDVFEYDMTYTVANEFIQEISHWDGYRRNDNYIDYDGGVEENADYVAYVGFIAGWRTSQVKLYDNRTDRQANHRVTLTRPKNRRPFKVSNKFNISREHFEGEVYCVEVPTHRIVVKKNGFMFVSGNCHEAKGKQYEDVLNYFQPAYTVGLTGTPFRLDGKKLTDGLFDKIVYEKNIKWGIENDYLCDVEAVRAYIGYDLSSVRTQGGDYNITDLNEAVIGTEDAIAEAYEKYGKGKPTLIFATGVDHAKAIASKIDGAEVIIGETPQEERDRIFNGFENQEIPVIVSVQVMTQGVDLPISEVGIFAKPTKSVGRYQQQVGRILRTHPNKEKALIVDCVGTSNLGLCTAPNLIGIDLAKVHENKRDELVGDLMDMPELVEMLSDIPMSWIRNEKVVNLWAKENDYNTDKVNYFQLPDGRMVVSLPERAKITLPPPDMLGQIDAREIKGMSPDLLGWGLDEYGNIWPYQRALNAVRANLERNYGDSASLWDLKRVRAWGKKPATEAQMKLINRRLKNEELPDELTRFEASQIINRIKNGYKPGRKRK